MSNDFEALDKILDGRYSCRAFQDKAVPIEDIHAIIQAAQKVPSWCNFQPWQVHLVSGDVRDALSEKVLAAAIAHEGGQTCHFQKKRQANTQSADAPVDCNFTKRWVLNAVTARDRAHRC